jgi:hypothetical protein
VQKRLNLPHRLGFFKSRSTAFIWHPDDTLARKAPENTVDHFAVLAQAGHKWTEAARPSPQVSVFSAGRFNIYSVLLQQQHRLELPDDRVERPFGVDRVEYSRKQQLHTGCAVRRLPVVQWDEWRRHDINLVGRTDKDLSHSDHVRGRHVDKSHKL